MKCVEFSYANLTQKLLREKVPEIEYVLGDIKYRAALGQPGIGSSTFIFISDMSDPQGSPCDEGIKFKDNKLKFHISLPEHARSQFAQGWDIVKDILIDHRVNMFKVVHEDERMSGGNGDQRGKDVTIYAQYNSEKSSQDWQTLIQQITQQLVAISIPPGYATVRDGPRADLPIKNCNYISYRYEKELYMTQILAHKTSDLCQRIIINVDNQPSPQPWLTPPGQEKALDAILDPKF